MWENRERRRAAFAKLQNKNVYDFITNLPAYPSVSMYMTSGVENGNNKLHFPQKTLYLLINTYMQIMQTMQILFWHGNMGLLAGKGILSHKFHMEISNIIITH